MATLHTFDTSLKTSQVGKWMYLQLAHQNSSKIRIILALELLPQMHNDSIETS